MFLKIIDKTRLPLKLFIRIPYYAGRRLPSAKANLFCLIYLKCVFFYILGGLHRVVQASGIRMTFFALSPVFCSRLFFDKELIFDCFWIVPLPITRELYDHVELAMMACNI